MLKGSSSQLFDQIEVNVAVHTHAQLRWGALRTLTYAGIQGIRSPGRYCFEAEPGEDLPGILNSEQAYILEVNVGYFPVAGYIIQQTAHPFANGGLVMRRSVNGGAWTDWEDAYLLPDLGGGGGGGFEF